MKRAIRRFVASLEEGPRKVVFIVVLFLVCVVALCLVIYAQFFYKYADTDPLMIGINIGSKKTAEEIAILKSNFNNLFTNSVKINSENVNVEKIDSNNSNIVYTGYDLTNEDENYYNINVKIPVLNINTDVAKQINSEIKKDFYDLANNIMRRSQGNTVYTVSYAAFINEDILSIAVKSSLKEQDKAEKVTVKTYNYNMPGKKIATLNDLIELKGTTSKDVQSTIEVDVKDSYNNARLIAEEFGNLYERDLSSDIYKVENTENFFLTEDGYVYIVYAYGNNDYTNEMDIIIF